MRGPLRLRGHLFVSATGPPPRHYNAPLRRARRPATKLTTQMIVMTCFFATAEQRRREEGREDGAGGQDASQI